MTHLPRREFVKLVGGTAAALGLRQTLFAADGNGAPRRHTGQQALIAITFDLEMSANFPRWEMTHWNFEKGNLDEPTKRYTVETARRIKAHGGVLHSFVVGQVLEQEDVGWLKALVAAGHPLGNHTYDHVRVTATKSEELGYRFQRAPWLLRGMTPRQAIEDNIRLVDAGLRTRVGVPTAGFRTPGGFTQGLRDRPDLQAMLVDLGFHWVSSLYPRDAMGPLNAPGEAPDAALIDRLVNAQSAAQPFRYPNGLVEIPMAPITDISAFRNPTRPWKLDEFVTLVRRCVEWTIEMGGVYDFVSHPSCLGVVDPEFRTIDAICERVSKSKGRAALVDLETIARRFRE